MRYLPAAIALVLLLGACSGGPASCGPKDAACATEALKAHRAKKASTWKEYLERPLEDRIGPGPAHLVEFIALDNISHQYPNKPRAAEPDPAFLADVRRAVAGMPEAVRKRIAPKLAGIFFVEDIGSSGFADQFRDASGRPVGGLIILDPMVLRGHTANSWMTWRDGTPFKPDADWRLEGVLAAPGEDNRVGALQYILLHEFAHILSIGERFHPNWELDPRDVKTLDGFPFSMLSWRTGTSGYRTPFDGTFRQRADIVYYFGPKIPGNEMVATYEALGKTPFPTLYAATSPGDDFAEAFANYVHARMLGKPFEIRLLHQGTVAKTYRNCWDEERCAGKRAILEAYLAGR